LLNFGENFVFSALEAVDSDQVIQVLADSLHQAGMVDEDYGKATISREEEHPTGLPTKPYPVAFPHADADGVHHSALAVASLKKPVVFKNMGDPDEDLQVELVIMLANKSPEEQIDTLRSLAELFGESEKLTELKSLSKSSDITAWMKKELSIQG
jgi:PTS system galactitol-specific IIA component